MIAESRAATDMRHRVPYPNARPRRVALIGLGERGRAIANGVEAAQLAHVRVIRDPSRALDDADMVFAVIGGGDDPSDAPTLARLAHQRNLLLTGVIVDDSTTPKRDLEAMRRACDMLVMTADADYLVGMLGALGTG